MFMNQMHRWAANKQDQARNRMAWAQMVSIKEDRSSSETEDHLILIHGQDLHNPVL